MNGMLNPDEIAPWRMFAADALDDLQQLGDYGARLCPQIGEQFRAAYSIVQRALNHTDIALGVAKARDFAPEFNVGELDTFEPSALAQWIVGQELKKLSAASVGYASERLLSNVCFTLARLASGNEIDEAECKCAIEIVARKSGMIDDLGLAAFRQIARRSWDGGLRKPRKLIVTGNINE